MVNDTPDGDDNIILCGKSIIVSSLEIIDIFNASSLVGEERTTTADVNLSESTSMK